MLLIGVGDIHITGQTPENRVDNYPETQFGKINHILKRAKELGAIILSPGDLFDTPKLSYEVFQRYLKLFLEYKIPIYTVPGQHDLRYHTSLKNSPMFAMHIAKALQIVTGPVTLGPNIILYGAGWNKEIPKLDQDQFNILITHKMIVEEKLWSSQTEYINGSHFIRQYKYDLVVSGDNHKGFMCSSRSRRLFNMGSLMRKAIDQTEHIPSYVIFNTEDGSYITEQVPHLPASKVFQMTVVEKEKERNLRLESFVSGLGEQKEIGLEYESNLFNYVKENGIDDEVKRILEECIADNT